MIKTYPKRFNHQSVVAGSDEVVLYMPIPGGSVFRNLWVACKLTGGSTTQSHEVFYAMHGYVVPMVDISAVVTPDQMWDNQIPKESLMGSDIVDFDPTTGDTAPVFELGDISAEKLIGQTSAPERVFRRVRPLGLVDCLGTFDKAGSSYLPYDGFRTQVSLNMRVEVPSVFLLGLSSPDTLNTVIPGNSWFPNDEEEWTQLRYLEVVLEQAWMQMSGLTETGAETPWEDAATMLGFYMEQAIEDVAGNFAATTWNCFTNASFEIDLQGRRTNFSLTAQA